MIKLGQTTPITSIDPSDGSKAANLCAEQYDKLRDELLRSHLWNFAAARVKLAQLSDAPAFGFDYAYQLPAAWFRVVTVHDNSNGVGQVVYKIEGRTLLSNATNIYLRYVQKIADANTMDSQFREVLAFRIAMDLALPMTQSMSTRENMTKGFEAALSAAKGTDAVEDFPDAEPEDDWVAARYSGGWGT